MAQIDVLKAQIVRNDANTPWGFRLQGGAEQGQAISIMRVTPGSPADRIGIKSGDEVTHIADHGTKQLTLQQSHDLITQHGQTLILTLERRVGGPPPSGPLLTPPPEAEPPGDSQPSYDTYHPPAAEPAYHHQPTSVPQPPPQPQQPQQSEPLPQDVIIRMVQPPRPLTPPTPPKFYQPYAFNRPQPTAAAPVIPKKYFLQTAPSRTFEAPPAGPRYPPGHSQPADLPQQYTPPQPQGQACFTPQEEYDDSDVTQSRTFKSLQSLMRNEVRGSSLDVRSRIRHNLTSKVDPALKEPASGVVGLPPPRSAYRERAKQQEAERKRQNAANPQQRVKVFMPQQYNSPLSMYSAKNVVHSFQTQAEGYYDQKEGSQNQDPSQFSNM